MEAQRDIQELGEQRDTRHENVSQRSLQTHNGNIFQCDHCYKTYPIISKLRDHMSQTHLSLVRFKCGMCSFLNYHRAHVKQHWYSVHSGPPIISDLEFHCEICSKKFSTESSLRKHISRRHSDFLQCPLCVENTIFLTVESLKVHFLSLHGMEPWENHQFSKYTQTLQQVSKVNQDPKNNKYFCFVCKVHSFPFRCKLLTHVMQTHYKIYPYDCTLCLFQTSKRTKIKEHYLDDHPNSEFQELINNKVDLFRSKQKKMPRQRRNKHGKNSTEIPMANIVKEFEIESNSSEMILEETMDGLPESENKSEHLPNEMCYEYTSTCEICQEICLKKHIQYRPYIGPVHGNTKYRFQCVKCDYRTHNIGLLKYHIRAQHITSSVENFKIKSACQFCWKTLKPDSNMETHVKENHSSDLCCVECGEMFTSICLLRDHVTNSHGFQKYVEWLKDKIYEVKRRVGQMDAPQLACYICEERKFRTIYMKTNLIYHILKGHFQVRKLKCKFCIYQCLRISTMCKHIENKHNDRRKCEKLEDLRNFWEPIILGQENFAKSQIAVKSSTKVEKEELMDDKRKLAYNCPKCSYTSLDTKSVLDLKLHLQMNHFTPKQISSPDVRYLFRCKMCKTNYWSRNNLDIHISKNHSLEICCPICKTLLTVDVLKRHFKSFHGEIAWIKHLSAILDQIGIKIQNLHNNPSTGYVRCSICSTDFKNKDSVFKHVMSSHFTPRKRILKCEHCSYVCTKNISLMKKHMIKYHCVKIIPILGAETILYIENGHIDQRHEGTNAKKLEISFTKIASSEKSTAKPLMCSQNSSAKKDHAVKKHSTSNIPILGAETIFYTEKRSFDQRSKSFNTKKLEVSSTRAVNSQELTNDCSERNTPILGAETIFYRINHPIDQSSESMNPRKLEIPSTRISSEQHTIECYICGQELWNENALMIHIEEMHSDISLPYFCQLCHEFFTHEFSFETHWYLAHCETQPLHSRIALQSKSVSFKHAFLSRFPCKFCNTYFATETKLVLHEENVEVHPNVYLCFMCEFSSESSQAVKAHIKVKHPSYSTQNLTELFVVDESTPGDGNESTDLIEQSTAQSIINQSESIPDLITSSCINPTVKVEPLYLLYNTVTDCPEENLNSEYHIKQEMDVDEITIKEEELTTFSDQTLNETLNQPGILEGSNNFTAYSTQVSHTENPTPGFPVLQFERVEHNDTDFGVEDRRDPENIVENQDKETKQEKQVEELRAQVGEPCGEQRGWEGVEPPQGGQGHVVGRCKRKVGEIKEEQRAREGSRTIHPRGESSQFGKKRRLGRGFVQEAVSHPTPTLTHLTTAPVYSGTSFACCSPDLLAGSGAQGRRVTSRPYPDSLPPVPGGCLPCSVQL